MKKVVAIVPCFNEADRIEKVLSILVKVSLFTEIIVVDDGSTDSTYEKVKKFPVTYLRNPKNRGKAFAMKRGVDASDGDILFFCDADLVGLKSEIIEGIIQPVIDGETDMSIGVRGNKMQRLTKLSALLSGERALKRELWDQLPDYYKKKFRIEMGLNKYAKHYGSGFVYHFFDDYFQTLKEIKYGFLIGFKRRMLMYLDVYWAYITFQVFHYPIKKRRLPLYVFHLILSLLLIGLSVFFIGLGTRAGSIYLWNLISKISDFSFIKAWIVFVKDLSQTSLKIIGLGILVFAIVFLLLNLIALFRWGVNFKNKSFRK